MSRLTVSTLHISFPKDELNAALTKLSLATRRDLPALLREAMRRVARHLAIETQPWGTGADIRRNSEGKIFKDLFGGADRPGVFMTVKDSVLRKNGRIYDKGNNVRLFVSGGTVHLTDQSYYQRDAAPAWMRAWHQTFFQRGKMRAPANVTQSNGRVVHHLQPVVGKKAALAYFRQAIQKVGFAKGGWATCAQILGDTKLPAWIMRHAGQAPGEVIETGGEKPSVTIRNLVPYVSYILKRHLIDNVIAVQVEGLNNSADAIVAHAAKKLGFRVKNLNKNYESNSTTH